MPEQDPHQEREAQTYDNPIPSREYIMLLLEQHQGPMTFRRISNALELDDDDRLEGLRRRLRAMERDGQLHFNRRGGYGLLSQMNLVRGRIIGHPDGFGFLVPDEGKGDIFLSATEMRACFHGDRVVAYATGVDQRGRKEGAITEILEHAQTTVAGRFYLRRGIGFVVADNRRVSQDIQIPEEMQNEAVDGQLVVAKILEYPTKRSRPVGQITEVLGEHMAPGLEIDMSIHSHAIPTDWSEGSLAEAAKLPETVQEEDWQGYEDLRDLPLVTIDGEDSKDFDDAVYASNHGKGWRLLVAIADVSHYVAMKSALDEDAKIRGNSVYFPGRVVPMLPEKISNGLCSLNPGVDRLSLVCDMEISAKGNLKSYRFYQAVIHSHARLTYTQVSAMLERGDQEVIGLYKSIFADLETLYGLYKALLRQRYKRGAFEIDSTETRIVFGTDKKIEKIVAVERNEAHRLIEECMLSANVAAADFLARNKMPLLYRVHAPPGSEKLTGLREFLGELGLSLKGGDKPSAGDYSQLLQECRPRDDFHLIQTVMLRSLSQARYTPDNDGHFGLSYPAYTHFTSPIRRYPDLLVHRAIVHLSNNGGNKSYPFGKGDSLKDRWNKLRGRGADKGFHYSHADMVSMGEHCSMTERRADEATRDVTDWLKCEYMLDRVGEQFTGLITSVTSFGIFVSLDDLYIEGLVHVTALKNDFYNFDATKHRLVGERSHQIYRLADKVDVRVMRVDLDDRKIDFELAGIESEDSSPKPRRKKGGGKSSKGRKRH